MLKLYSKGCQYALCALAHVIEHEDQDRFSAKDVCEAVQIPESFTRKIFQALVQGGFLEAHRGPGGGYSLTRPAEDISLLDVIEAVDGKDTFNHCLMGFENCDAQHPCPMHETWAASRVHLLERLRNQTLADVHATSMSRQIARDRQTQQTRKAAKHRD